MASGSSDSMVGLHPEVRKVLGDELSGKVDMVLHDLSARPEIHSVHLFNSRGADLVVHPKSTTTVKANGKQVIGLWSKTNDFLGGVNRGKAVRLTLETERGVIQAGMAGPVLAAVLHDPDAALGLMIRRFDKAVSTLKDLFTTRQQG